MTIEDLIDNLEELKSKLPVDKFNLDDVVIEHPSLVAEVGYLLARATSAKDSAKADLESTHAELSNYIRSDAAAHEGRYQGLKLTEGRIESEVKSDPKYIKKSKNYIELRKVESNAYALRESFESRGRMIKILVDLYLAQYWSTTAPKNQADKSLSQMNESRAADIRKKQSEHRKSQDNS